MKRHGHKNKHFSAFFLFIFLFLLSVFFFYHFEKQMIPSLQEISHVRSQAMANAIINDAIDRVLAEKSVTSADFISIGENGDYSANITLINNICSSLSQQINSAAENLPKEQIEIPLGAAINSNLFANMGPSIPFTLLPAGTVTSDYETDFQSAGINQINYKIWINIHFEIQIVNPLYREKVSLHRKIMLVDTVIGGKVPDYYMNLGQNGNTY